MYLSNGLKGSGLYDFGVEKEKNETINSLALASYLQTVSLQLAYLACYFMSVNDRRLLDSEQQL